MHESYAMKTEYVVCVTDDIRESSSRMFDIWTHPNFDAINRL